MGHLIEKYALLKKPCESQVLHCKITRNAVEDLVGEPVIFPEYDSSLYMPSLIYNRLREYDPSGALAEHSRRIGKYVAYSQKLKEDSTPAKVVGAFLAAMTHDIGKLYVPSHLRHRDSEPFTQEEKQEYTQSHALIGAMILQAWGYPEECVLTALFHHRLGEPKAQEILANRGLTDLVTLIGVEDIYDALNRGGENRRYRRIATLSRTHLIRELNKMIASYAEHLNRLELTHAFLE